MKIVAAKEVVICEQPDNKTKSGLLLSDDDKGDKVPEMGKVIEIGKGEKPVPFKKGDLIVFRRYADNRIPVKGKPYNFIEFKDVMAVVKE